MSGFHTALLRLMVLMMRADRRIRRAETDMIARIVEEVTGRSLSEAEILDEAERLEREPVTLDDDLEALRSELREEEKVMVIRAAALVSVADRSLHRSEKTLLIRLGRGLRMSPERIRAIAEELGATEP